jgi:hypothetical protein
LTTSLPTQVNFPVLALAGIIAGVAKTVGPANQSIPPPFSLGFYHDDLLSGSALFAVALFAWGAQSARQPQLRLPLLQILTLLTAVAAVFSLAFVPALVLGALAATNAFALGTYTPTTAAAAASPTAATPAASSGSVGAGRALLLADAALLIFLAGARVALGVDELHSLPAQPQVRYAAPLAAGLAAALLWARQRGDVTVLRSGLCVGAFLAFCASSFLSNGSTKPSAAALVARWGARALLVAHVAVYSRSPFNNAAVNAVRRVTTSLTRLGGLSHMGDE